MGSSETEASQGTLKKELGLIVLIFLIIGLNVGGSLFVLTSLSAAILDIIFMLLLIFIMFKSKNQWAVWLFVIAIMGGLVLNYIKKKMGLVRKPEILTD